MSSLQLELLTSVAGFQLRPQHYIAGAQFTAPTSTWFWPSTATTAQTFTFFLSVSFREAVDDDAVESAEDVFKTIANDLFYPFNVHAYQ